jgi:alkylhydroperoxidase family enzyme
VKVTHASPQLCQEDVDELRAHGWTDAAISDAIQVIAYFNYIIRVADAVGIDDEPEWAEPTDSG